MEEAKRKMKKYNNKGDNESQCTKGEEKFRIVFESSPIALVMIDEKGKIILVNPQTEKYFGYTSDELLGQSMAILVPKRFRREHLKLCEDFFRDPEVRSLGAGRDLHAVRKGGVEFPVEIGLKPIKTTDGLVVLASIIDITERKQAEEEKRKLETQMLHAQKLESLGVITGRIAHDFNNLLTGILSNASLALLELAPHSPTKTTIEDIEKSAIYAAEICKQLLAYSGKGGYLIQPLSLNEIIHEMAGLLRVSASKKVVVNYDLNPNLPAVEAEPTQIRQVVMNLILNASEAIGDKRGSISITTGLMECDRTFLNQSLLGDMFSEGTYVYLEVADTGCGIDNENLKNIFDPFFTSKSSGRGLGLAALFGIVRDHNGAIRLDSELGQGTTFKIIFPPSEKLPLQPSKETQYDQNWRGAGKILVIDDEETVCRVIRKTLEFVGFTILTSSNGSEGLKVFKRNTREFSLVILDVTLPNLSGEKVLSRIHRIRADLPAILISGYYEEDLKNRFAEKGLVSFMPKPFTAQTLIAKVRNALNKGEVLAQL